MTMMNAMPASTVFSLPEDVGQTALSSLSWSREEGERLRLAIITVVALVFFVPLALVIPALEVPSVEREKAERIPPQLARLLVNPPAIEKPAPLPVKEVAAPPVEEPAPADPKLPEPEPAKAEPVKPQPKPAPKPMVEKPEIAAKPATQTVEQARAKASRSGLLSMKDRLASMRQPPSESAPAIQANTGSTDGTAGGIRAKAAGESVKKALAGSGGVRNVQTARPDVEVAGHQVSKVQKPSQPEAPVASAPAQKQVASAGERAMSNIRKVFDAGKTALYSLYQRELRQDPTLKGKVLLELVIEPDGSVSACKVVSSDLNKPALEQKIAMRVRLFNFGADNVETRKVRFPIDFLPG
ncbi:hypothetical protein GCM10011533_26020 [Streptosporangium jomthongense]|uniref:AgmX/PglI C-terminal domain-containing protein n=1 Tax=Marinobacter aromaticivorans TaxID=1494078 RepID=A0ABW2IWQ9_9GAMM|nr:AgmX/PglI C-terminal domain-containing protein [Marinobacter aromaticivorans]GGE72457.1 hypothetical protein GCM10011533_26020 [Streptosporangium jomthongense]